MKILIYWFSWQVFRFKHRNDTFEQRKKLLLFQLAELKKEISMELADRDIIEADQAIDNIIEIFKD